VDEQILFPDKKDFRQWLAKNHATNKGIWLILSKTSKIGSIKPDEALEEALCFGWIDGLIKSIDEETYIKKFTPRRKGSNWSARNIAIVNRLIREGKLAEPGLNAVEKAQKNGAWNTPERVRASDDQIEILLKDINGTEPALSNFLKMPASVRKTYTSFYLDAKKEATRVNRLKYIIGRLNENKKPM